MCLACPSGLTCSPAGLCITAPVCVPKSCGELAYNCGQADDGCGGTLNCGTCASGTSCGGGGKANVCGPGTCTPKDCTEQLFDCGRASDGCAAVLECGTCAAGKTCGGAGQANVCGGCTVTTTCAAQGKNCGSIPDGCGGQIQCGTCGVGQSCGGGGNANVCGNGTCTPKTCAALGKNCGTVSDGCSAVLSCGSCPGGIACGGGGTANVCGATCNISCPSGFSCNTLGQCAGGNLTALVLNEIGHQVSGVVRVNGALPTTNGTYCQQNIGDEIGVVRFREKAKGYSAAVPIGCGSSNFDWSTLLPPGTYEVRVDRGYYGTSAGVNLLPVSYVANEALVVNGPLTNLTLNEVGHQVSGVVRVNGALPQTNGSYCQQNIGDEIGVVRFREKTLGYSAAVPIGCGTSNFDFGTVLPPGTYEVRVDRGYYGTSAGVNLLPVSYVANAALVVNGPVANLTLNEVGHAVSGVIRVNGALPTTNGTYCQQNLGDEIGVVRFSEKTLGYSATAVVGCGTTNFDWNVLLPPGTWEVRVDRGYYGTSAGVNLLPVSYQAQAALVVNGPVANLTLNEVGHAVSGVVRVNGALPQTNGTYCQQNIGDEIGVVRFSEKTLGYSAAVPIGCGTTNFDWSTLLPPGTYQVRVDRGYYGTSAGVNLLPVSYVAIDALVVSGALSNQTLNEVGHAVSGVVRVNGALPLTNGTYCQQNVGDEIGVVRFREKSLGYSAAVPIACGTSNFAWSTVLPPGNYEVRVDRGYYGTSAGVNLLGLSYLAQESLAVNGAVGNVVLDEVARPVGGVVTVNGAVPTTNGTYCQQNVGDEIGVVRFSEKTKGYSAAVSIGCGTTNFAFSTQLPPGAWDVRVDRGYYGTSAAVNLLPVSYFAIERLLVP